MDRAGNWWTQLGMKLLTMFLLPSLNSMPWENNTFFKREGKYGVDNLRINSRMKRISCWSRKEIYELFADEGNILLGGIGTGV
jgi:hypothetical protein